jgi:hypothetical protein
MDHKQQAVKNIPAIAYLKKSELRQVYGGINEKEEAIVVATSTILGAAIGGSIGAVAGHKIGTASVDLIKAFSKKIKKI